MNRRVPAKSILIKPKPLTLLVTLLALTGPAVAQTPVVTGPNIFRDFRDTNDLGIPPGDVFQFGGDVTGGSANVTIQGLFTANSGTGSFTTGTVVCGPLVANAAFCARDAGFSTARLDGTWQARFTNGSGSTTVALPSVTNIPPAHAVFPINVSLSLNAQNRPTISWDAPAGAVFNTFRVNVYDRTQRTAQGLAQVLETSSNLNASSRSYTPTTVFSPTGSYSLGIQVIQTRDGTSNAAQANILSRSSSYFAYARPTSNVPVFAPRVLPNNLFKFHVENVGPQVILIDPAIAYGYDYAIGAGDPNFASVTFPTIGNISSFTLQYASGGQPFSTSVAPNQQFVFPSGGVPAFTVTGLAPANISPSDGGAFVTGISFVAPGTFTGTMNPRVSGNTIVAATLPSSRSIRVGSVATAFASIINTGAAATGCGIVPAEVTPATFSYQTTNPATNVLTGSSNTRVNIAAGATQTFLLAFTANDPMPPREVAFGFNCLSSDVAPTYVGVNTLLLSFNASPVPDLIAIGSTASNDGIVTIPAATNLGFFAAAAVNIGAAATITATADEGGAGVPVNLSLCQTNPVSGVCINPAVPGGSATVAVAQNETVTFSVFAASSGAVVFDPANHRLFLRLKEAGGATRGSTSVAVRTQ